MHIMRTAIRTSVPWFLALACVFTLAPADAAVAQTVTGTLQGTVTDSSGAMLPGATVIIRNDETGGVREVITNDVGFYAAPYCPSAGIRSRRSSTDSRPSCARACRYR